MSGVSAHLQACYRQVRLFGSLSICFGVLFCIFLSVSISILLRIALSLFFSLSRFSLDFLCLLSVACKSALSRSVLLALVCSLLGSLSGSFSLSLCMSISVASLCLYCLSHARRLLPGVCFWLLSACFWALCLYLSLCPRVSLYLLSLSFSALCHMHDGSRQVCVLGMSVSFFNSFPDSISIFLDASLFVSRCPSTRVSSKP